MKAQDFASAEFGLRRNQYLLYGSVAGIILVVVITTLVSLTYLRRQAETRVAVTTQNMALSLDQTMEGIVDAIDVALLASTDEIRRQMLAGEMDQQSITRMLIRQQHRLALVDGLRATDERGQIIYGPETLSPPIDASDREYFTRLREDSNAGLFISSPFVGRLDKQWVWLFARRINTPDESFGGVVFARMPIDRLDRMLAKISMDSGGSAAIRDAGLGVITRHTFSTTNPIAYGDKKLSKPFEDALNANPREGTYISGETSIDGITRVHSYRRNPKYGFIVNIGIAGEAIRSEWRSQATIVAGLASAFTLTMLALAWSINRAWRRQEWSMAVLEASESRFRSIIETSPVPHALYDAQGNIVYLNASFVRTFGYVRDDIRTLVEWWAKAYPDPAYRQWVATAWQERVERARREYATFEPLEVHIQCKDGTTRFALTSGAQVGAASEGFHLVTLYDITERKQLEDQVHELAFQDTLTELPNRRLLNDRLSQAMAASKRSGCYGALIFLDLDNFKLLNDTRGHAVGDLLLVEAANRLKSCVRELDTVARFGGDEFVVMIAELSVDASESTTQAGIIAEKIRAVLAKPYAFTIQPEGKAETAAEHRCTASIGVTLFGKHDASQEDILKQADAAMYQAKEAGCNLIRSCESKAV